MPDRDEDVDEIVDDEAPDKEPKKYVTLPLETSLAAARVIASRPSQYRLARDPWATSSSKAVTTGQRVTSTARSGRRFQPSIFELATRA